MNNNKKHKSQLRDLTKKHEELLIKYEQTRKELLKARRNRLRVYPRFSEKRLKIVRINRDKFL